MTRLLVCLSLLFAANFPAAAQTTYTYEYDVFGQLVRSERSTGASTRVRYTYDDAGNRSKVKKGVSAPDAQDDLQFISLGYDDQTIYPQGNDLDDDLPFDSFTITAIGGPDAGYVTIQSGGAFLYFDGPPGAYTVTYTIQDIDGNTDSATITIYAFQL